MVAVIGDKIHAGSVVHLSPEHLIQAGGCLTIARKGQEVRGSHMFLITQVRADRTCVATPLYTGKNNLRDRVELDPNLKDGAVHDWREHDSIHHYYKWQFWIIPLDRIEAASAQDNSPANFRRTYAVSRPDILADLDSHLARAREPWRCL